MANDNLSAKSIQDDEVLQQVVGGITLDISPHQDICPCCGRFFWGCSGHTIGGILYCEVCWQNRDKLNIKGAYRTENGAAGSW